jgi:single-stranded DNA-binding protein
MNYQRIILVGNVTRDAERRTSQSGEVTYTAFGVGVSDGKDKTTFFPVLVFDKYGEADRRPRLRVSGDFQEGQWPSWRWFPPTPRLRE